jgi:hypothetical protein
LDTLLLSPFFWFGIVVFFAVAVVFFSRRREGRREVRRREGLAQFAAMIGFTVHPDMPVPSLFKIVKLLRDPTVRANPEAIRKTLSASEGPDSQPMDFPVALHLFTLGPGSRAWSATNIITGNAAGAECFIFDYTYITGSGKGRTDYRQTVFRFRKAGRELPIFALGPENLFHKIGQVFGYQDIDFPENPAFSGRFLLRGPDETAIRKAFTPERISELEPMTGICVEGAGPDLLVYRPQRIATAAGYPACFEEAQAIHAMF